MLLAALVVLGSAQAFATSPEVTVAAARSRLVDYPETHPLVWGEFDKYHYPKYAEIITIMNNWAAKWPDLVEVYSAGKSFEGLDIWQMTITNKATGPAEHKPAMFVGANRHSGEVTTRPAALEFAWDCYPATAWTLNHHLLTTSHTTSGPSKSRRLRDLPEHRPDQPLDRAPMTMTATASAMRTRR